MMFIFTIITIIQSSIPHKYDDLVSAALKSADTKIAKTSREDTKYPNFLGLEISVGAFINFALDLDNIKVSIPLGFDYFKGYRITATKYYEITPTSITDSKWETNINELPQIYSTIDVFKSILSSKFSAAIQFRPFISLEFSFGSFGSGLECELKFPV